MTEKKGNAIVEDGITLIMGVEQARVTAKALDIFARLSMGQLKVIEEMVSMGEIPVYAQQDAQNSLPSIEMCDIVRKQVEGLVNALGYSGFGHSLGIGNKHVSISGHRAYEVSRVLEKTLAEHHDPEPTFRGVNYDGLRLRYTQDRMPVARVIR